MNGLIPPPAERDPDLIPLAPPNTRQVRWEGEVYTDEGEYKMELRTDGRARLLIDDSVVLDLCDNEPDRSGIPRRGGDPGVGAAITLGRGWHRVRLDLDATGDANGLEWAWVRPDGVREIVPPPRLRYTSDFLNPQTRLTWPDVPSPITCTR
jgi:hypothetical protein